MKTSRFLLIGALLLSFVVGMFVSQSFIKSEVVLGTSAVQDTDTKSESNYQRLQQKLSTDFKIEGFEEATKGVETIVVVPDSVAGEQSTGPDGIYQRQKNLIFKHQESGTVILLSLSKNDKAAAYAWTHSIGYDSKVHNSPQGDFKDTYSETFPKTDVYVYSFEGKGYSINLTSFANATDQLISLDLLAQFTDQLSHYLKENDF